MVVIGFICVEVDPLLDRMVLLLLLLFIFVLLQFRIVSRPAPRSRRARSPQSGGRAGLASRERRGARTFSQGFQGYGFHLSANPVEFLWEMNGLTFVVLLFLRIWAPLTVYVKQYPWNRPNGTRRGGRGWPHALCRTGTAIFHTKNCRTKNLWVKIPKSPS